MKTLLQPFIKPIAWLCLSMALVIWLIQLPFGLPLLMIYFISMLIAIVLHYHNRPEPTDQQKKIDRIIAISFFLLVAGGSAKFYHYNFIANQLGQANNLKLSLRDFVCKSLPLNPTPTNGDHCGKRSIYGGGSHYWGITAYYAVYGIETEIEAKAIAKYMIDTRKKNGQEHIPMQLEVYSIPRSETGSGHPKKHRLFNEDL